MLGSAMPVAGHFLVTWLLEMIFPASQMEKTPCYHQSIDLSLTEFSLVHFTYRPEEDPIQVSFFRVKLKRKSSGITNRVRRASECRRGGQTREHRSFLALCREEVGAGILLDFIARHGEFSISAASFGMTESDSFEPLLLLGKVRVESSLPFRDTLTAEMGYLVHIVGVLQKLRHLVGVSILLLDLLRVVRVVDRTS